MSIDQTDAEERHQRLRSRNRALLTVLLGLAVLLYLVTLARIGGW